MNPHFECKIRYEKTMENGMKKKVTESYLVNALSFTEAESRIIEEMYPFISGGFKVNDIKRANYAEVVFIDNEKADKWYAVRLKLITLNEKKGVEKGKKLDYLIQASDLNDAKERTHEMMKGTMSDYEIIGIKETAIMDVFQYKGSEVNND